MQHNAKNKVGIERLAVNAQEAARMLGISERTLWARAGEGVIPTKRLGGRVLFPIEALRNLLNADWDNSDKEDEQ